MLSQMIIKPKQRLNMTTKKQLLAFSMKLETNLIFIMKLFSSGLKANIQSIINQLEKLKIIIMNQVNIQNHCLKKLLLEE